MRLARHHLVVAAVLIVVVGEGSAWIPGSCGRQKSPGLHILRRYRRMTATEEEAAISSSNDDDNDDNNILEDSAGHINRDLAEKIWSWEQERRKSEQLPKLEYSVRSGLRLVDSLVEDIMRKKSPQGSRRSSSQLQQSDLVQEGLSALLDAMSHYRHENVSGDDFESYARRHIRQQLALFLDEGAGRPLKLPQAVQTVVRQAHRLMSERLRQQRRHDDDNNTTSTTTTAAPPTWASVAQELHLPLERLQTYLRLARTTSRALSMESTVEILHPSTLDDSTFADQDEWELRQGLLLDDGHSVRKDQVISEYLDEMVEQEGDDQAWVLQQEQIAGPLPELIPDDEEPSPDDLILQELIRTDLSNFLTNSLSPQQVAVVRLVFGLQEDSSSGTGGPQTSRQTARALGIPEEQVPKILEAALEKLRASYNARFVGGSQYDNDGDDDDDAEDYVLDSV